MLARALDLGADQVNRGLWGLEGLEAEHAQI